MKKAYTAPKAGAIELHSEYMLALSVGVDGGHDANASDSYSQRRRGWDSSDWSRTEETAEP